MTQLYNAREALEQNIPDEIWAVVLPYQEWSTENGTWFENQADLLEHIYETDCIEEVLCVTSNIRDRKTGTRIYCTHHPFDVEEWLNEFTAARDEEARHMQRDMSGEPS